MKVAIIGANGQLGMDLQKVFSKDHEIIALNHENIEITDIDNVKQVLSNIGPDIILNTAASHVVPKCEDNPAQAFSVNGIGALNLAKIATDLKSKLVHYSTDYVFDGNKNAPYVETDVCNPLNVYATTKLAGENFVLTYSPNSYVVRVSGIYGATPCRAKGGNFITTMLRLAKEKPEVRVVNDEILTPTPTSAIAENTLALVNTEAYGLYHMTSEGQCSWYEFARTIWDALQLETPLYPSSVKDSPLVVKRPFYSVLENENLKKIGINQMPHWNDALRQFLKAFS